MDGHLGNIELVNRTPIGFKWWFYESTLNTTEVPRLGIFVSTMRNALRVFLDFLNNTLESRIYS